MEPCITLDELNLRLKQQLPTAIFDVRGREDYDHMHIPDAIHIPLDQLEKIVPLLSKNVMYITVCGKGGGRSSQAVEILQSAGLHTQWLCGGTIAWFEQY